MRDEEAQSINQARMRHALQMMSGPREYAITIVQFKEGFFNYDVPQPEKGPNSSIDWTIMDWRPFETGAVIIWHRPKTN